MNKQLPRELTRAELEIDHQHGPTVRGTVGDISVAVYLMGETAIVTTPEGQYGIECTGPWSEFRELWPRALRKSPREPTEEMVEKGVQSLLEDMMSPVSEDADDEVVCRIYRAMHDAAPPSHDEDGVPYVDVAAEDVPISAEYLVTDIDGFAWAFDEMPTPNQIGTWVNAEGCRRVARKLAITNQPWFLTLRRIRRV